MTFTASISCISILIPGALLIRNSERAHIRIYPNIRIKAIMCVHPPAAERSRGKITELSSTLFVSRYLPLQNQLVETAATKSTPPRRSAGIDLPALMMTGRSGGKIVNEVSYPAVGRCPCCGGVGKIRTRRYRGNIAGHFVVCLSCGLSTRRYTTLKVAAEAWDRRPEDRLPEGLKNVSISMKGA